MANMVIPLWSNKDMICQGQIISTHNYKTYGNDLLLQLEECASGAHVANQYFGSPKCADDIIILNNIVDLQTQLDMASPYVVMSAKSLYFRQLASGGPGYLLRPVDGIFDQMKQNLLG